MAESLGDKLKRIAAEKKAARELAEKQASAAGGATPAVVPEVKTVSELEVITDERTTSTEERTGKTTGSADESVPDVENTVGLNQETTGESTGPELAVSGQVIESNEVAATAVAPRTASEHPLSMQFAEMEQALLAADPTFKTILRDVHRQLGQDPELVTMMTEDEIALIVRGLVVHAKAEIVEPAKAKTAKKAIAEAKKKAISADDL